MDETRLISAANQPDEERIENSFAPRALEVRYIGQPAMKERLSIYLESACQAP